MAFNQYQIPKTILAGALFGISSFTFLSGNHFGIKFIEPSVLLGSGFSASLLALVNGFYYLFNKYGRIDGYLVKINNGKSEMYNAGSEISLSNAYKCNKYLNAPL